MKRLEARSIGFTGKTLAVLAGALCLLALACVAVVSPAPATAATYTAQVSVSDLVAKGEDQRGDGWLYMVSGGLAIGDCEFTNTDGPEVTTELRRLVILEGGEYKNPTYSTLDTELPVDNYGTIDSGIFAGSIDLHYRGYIRCGIFQGKVYSDPVGSGERGCRIDNGIFEDDVEVNSEASVNGGYYCSPLNEMSTNYCTSYKLTLVADTNAQIWNEYDLLNTYLQVCGKGLYFHWQTHTGYRIERDYNYWLTGLYEREEGEPRPTEYGMDDGFYGGPDVYGFDMLEADTVIYINETKMESEPAATGWQVASDGTKTYIDADGTLHKGFLKLYKKDYTPVPDTETDASTYNVYYFRSTDGAMVTGLARIYGYYRYFDVAGIRQYGKLSVKWEDVINDEVDADGKDIHSDGQYHTMFFDNSGDRPTGIMASGKFKRLNSSDEIDPTSADVYYFKINGEMATGLVKVYGRWRYFDTSGIRQYGWHVIEGKIYCFDSYSGIAYTGNQMLGCTFDENGVLVA